MRGGGNPPPTNPLSVINVNQSVLKTIDDSPAVEWQSEILPLGNGFIGASTYGGVKSERILINEHKKFEKEKQKMKVMSFNLRVPAADDGINYFDNRKERILEVLRREKPDLIGFQEVRIEGKEWLWKELCDEYIILGCGRNENCGREYVPVAIRREPFELVKMETFWLSDTPDVPGSRYENLDQSMCVRIATTVSLYHKESKKMIRFANTHTDHAGKEARKKELTQILEYLDACPGYKIITGDMNAGPDSEEIQAFLKGASKYNVKDCTADLGDTFHGFGKYGGKIDYIFSDMNVLESHVIPDIPVNGVYYSDHRAVCADLEII